MPTRTSAPTGAPCWMDLSTPDEAASRAFWSALLGWTAGEGSTEFGGYFMFSREGRPVAGGMPFMPGQEGPGTWTVYLSVPDAKQVVDRAAEAGAQVVVPPMPVADLGTMAVVVDPAGAAVGLWEPGSFPGFVDLGDPGAPGWFEVLSTDYDRAVEFYRDVVGWDVHVMSDTPDFRYTTHGEGDAATAGIMDARQVLQGQPSRWQAYVMVEDTDAALAQAQELGGRVLVQAMETPYGRLGTVADPTGATLSLMGPSREGGEG